MESGWIGILCVQDAFLPLKALPINFKIFTRNLFQNWKFGGATKVMHFRAHKYVQEDDYGVKL
jgi:hypothetical protein